jgi:DNA-binding beta-propeller fold protein YncE
VRVTSRTPLRGRRGIVRTLAAVCAVASSFAFIGTAAASRMARPSGLASGEWRGPAGSPSWLAARFSHRSASRVAALLRGAASPSAAGRGVSVALGGIPNPPAINQKTSTIYVPLQNSNIVDVVNAAKCNLKITSGCRVVARARVGMFGPAGGPLNVTVDPVTDTVYVVNAAPSGNGSVTVVNGARCNARVTTGCDRVLATINVGKFPVAGVLARRTGTLYVANNAGNSISVIDAAGCNAAVRTACHRAARTLNDPGAPDWLDVNNSTGTLYAANGGLNGQGDKVAVFNAATCNARTGRGCAQTAHSVTVGSGPFGLAVDQASGAVYVANNNDGTISVINGSKCNARVHTGCGRHPRVVIAGPETGYVTVDPAVHTAFSLSGGDATISEINTRTCNGRTDAGCPPLARNERATFNPPEGGNPNALALVPGTGTAYLVSAGGATIMSVVSVAHCNATSTRSCRVLPPSAPNKEFLMAVDPATNTLYAGNNAKPRIDVINAATCRAGNPTGCHPVATIPMADPEANIGPQSIDPTTHTLYAADPFSDVASVINIATCNATHTAGCSASAPTINVGKNPGAPAFNKTTKTLYVPVGAHANKVAVINAATCNATNATGCGQVPAVVPVGTGTFNLAVSTAVNTVYAPATGYGGNGKGHTVAVIDGASCNGTNHAGCTHPAATVDVGHNPIGVDVSDKAHTVYVTNFNNGDHPGSISMINEATCNGAHTAGCAGRHPVVTVGPGPYIPFVDASTGTVYVSDFLFADVSVINGRTCNATRTSGCHAVRQIPVGSQPVSVAVSNASSSLYVALTFPSPKPLALVKIKS